MLNLNMLTVLQLQEVLRSDWDAVLQSMASKFSELQGVLALDTTELDVVEVKCGELQDIALTLRYLSPMLENIENKVKMHGMPSYTNMFLLSLDSFSNFLEFLVETDVGISVQLEHAHKSLAAALLHNESNEALEQQRKLISILQSISKAMPGLQQQLQEIYCSCVNGNYSGVMDSNNSRVDSLIKKRDGVARQIAKLSLLPETKNLQKKISALKSSFAVTSKQLKMQQDLAKALTNHSISSQRLQQVAYELQEFVGTQVSASESDDLFQYASVRLQQQQAELQAEGEELIGVIAQVQDDFQNNAEESSQCMQDISDLSENIRIIKQNIEELQSSYQESAARRSEYVIEYNQNIHSGRNYIAEHNLSIDQMNAIGTEQWVFTCPIPAVAFEYAPRYSALLQRRDQCLDQIAAIDEAQADLLEYIKSEEQYLKSLTDTYSEYIAEQKDTQLSLEQIKRKLSNLKFLNDQLQNTLSTHEHSLRDIQKKLDHNFCLQLLLQHIETVDNAVIEQIQLFEQGLDGLPDDKLEELVTVHSEALSNAIRNIAMTHDEFVGNVSTKNIESPVEERKELYSLQRNYVYSDVDLEEVQEEPLINNESIAPDIIQEIQGLQSEIAEASYSATHAKYMLDYLDKGPPYYRLKVARNSLATARKSVLDGSDVDFLEQESNRLHTEYEATRQEHAKTHATALAHLTTLQAKQQSFLATKVGMLSPAQAIELSTILASPNATLRAPTVVEPSVASEHKQAQESFKRALATVKASNSPQSWQALHRAVEHADVIHKRYVAQEGVVRRSVIRTNLNVNFAKQCAVKYSHPVANYSETTFAKRTREEFTVLATKKLELSPRAFNSPVPLTAKEAVEVDTWRDDLQKFFKEITELHERIIADSVEAGVQKLLEKRLPALDSADNALYDHFKLDDFAAIIKELRGVVIPGKGQKIYDHVAQKFDDNVVALHKMQKNCAEMQNEIRKKLAKGQVLQSEKPFAERLLDCLQRRIVLQDRIIKSINTRITAIQRLHAEQGVPQRIHLSTQRSAAKASVDQHPELVDQGGEHGTGVCKHLNSQQFRPKTLPFKGITRPSTALPASSNTFVPSRTPACPVPHTPYIEPKSTTRFDIRMPAFRPRVKPAITNLHPVLRQSTKLFLPRFNAIRANAVRLATIRPPHSTPVSRPASTVRPVPTKPISRVTVTPRINLNNIRSTVRSTARSTARPVIFSRPAASRPATTRSVPAVRSVRRAPPPPPARRAATARTVPAASSARRAPAVRRGAVRGPNINGGHG